MQDDYIDENDDVQKHLNNIDIVYELDEEEEEGLKDFELPEEEEEGLHSEITAEETNEDVIDKEE